MKVLNAIKYIRIATLTALIDSIITIGGRVVDGGRLLAPGGFEGGNDKSTESTDMPGVETGNG